MGPVLEGPDWRWLKRRYAAWGNENRTYERVSYRHEYYFAEIANYNDIQRTRDLVEPTGMAVLRAAKGPRARAAAVVTSAACFVAEAASAQLPVLGGVMGCFAT